MNFWKRFQRIGRVLTLAVLALAILLASAFPPPATQPTPQRAVPVLSPGPGGMTGTTGL